MEDRVDFSQDPDGATPSLAGEETQFFSGLNSKSCKGRFTSLNRPILYVFPGAFFLNSDYINLLHSQCLHNVSF